MSEQLAAPAPEAQAAMPAVAPAVETDRAAERRPLVERIARRVLAVENAEPRALMPMKGSLVLSAIRCVITYAIIPAMAPVVTGLGGLASPLSLTLSLVAIVMATVSLRRVWLADWSGRWAYTAFVLVVVALLVVTAVFDFRTMIS